MASEFLELYKIHADLADRVSQRRSSANRMFVSLLTSNLIFLAACLRFGVGDVVSLNLVLVAVGIFGLAFSVAWGIVIYSYRQLNTAKFKTLQELEKHLEFPFFSREWEIAKKNKWNQRYRELTIVEIIPAIIFGLVFLGMISAGLKCS